MLKRNKAISIVLAFVFCMTFLAPALVAPATAEASSTYEVLKVPAVDNAATNADLGVIKVTMADTAMIAYSRVTVSLPSDLDFATNDVVEIVNSASAGTGVFIVGGTGDMVNIADFDTVGGFTIESDNTFDITMKSSLATTAGSDKYFYIYFNNIDLNNTSGDIDVAFQAPSGSGFSSTAGLVIAKSSSEGSTTTTIKKVKDITDTTGDIDSITVMENKQGSLNLSGEITLEILTKGFEWGWDNNNPSTASYGWSLSGSAGTLTRVSSDYQKLELDLAGTGKTSAPAKVTFSGLQIIVNDDKADPGDEVEVKISGADMDKATIVVAEYVDYDVTVEEGTTKTLIAGQNKQKIGEFFIKEGALGSLVGNRTIKFALPTGVEWYAANTGDTEITNSSSITLNKPTEIDGDNNEILKWTVASAGSSNEGADIKFKDFKVNVSPAFTGDVELEVSGSAGAQGTIKVAEVVPAATISVDEVNNIMLGKPDQKIGDITITEGDVEALLENDMTLILDNGYRFTKEPTVKVIEGDLDIEEDVSVDKETLTIKVTGQSNKTASKILISGIYVDAYRTAPEGPVEIAFGKSSSKTTDTALNEVDNFYDKLPGKAVVANCVTAHLGETVGNGQFVISSNIYELNGVKKVMDAAPYIKNDRTYVPVRYLAYVLGLTDDDIVWDAASQKVTLTKGDTVVELTIGSTTMYVNGEAVTMDVAPEITNDRTFLPARYVAEAFGYQVGWDGATRTVLISK